MDFCMTLQFATSKCNNIFFFIDDFFPFQNQPKFSKRYIFWVAKTDRFIIVVTFCISIMNFDKKRTNFVAFQRHFCPASEENASGSLIVIISWASHFLKTDFFLNQQTSWTSVYRGLSPRLTRLSSSLGSSCVCFINIMCLYLYKHKHTILLYW